MRLRSLCPTAFLGFFLLGVLGPIGARADTKVSRITNDVFRLRHSSALSAAGGGARGGEKATEKAAMLCSILGFRYLRIQSASQFRFPSEGVGTRSGSTVLEVRCLDFAARENQAEGVPADTVSSREVIPVSDLLLDDPDLRRKVQAAVDAMHRREEKERRQAEKLAERTPEEVAADEAKAEKQRQKELERIRREDEKAMKKAMKKMGKPP